MKKVYMQPVIRVKEMKMESMLLVESNNELSKIIGDEFIYGGGGDGSTVR